MQVNEIQTLKELHQELISLLPSRQPLLSAQAPLPPLVLQCEEDCAFFFTFDGTAVNVRAARDNEEGTLITLSAEDWLGLSRDIEAVPPLIYGSRLSCPRGKLDTLLLWEPALRALYRGIPVYDPDSPDLQGLDPARCFTLNDTHEDMQKALNTLGYLVVHDVFSPGELEQFRRHASQLQGSASENDRHSWWGKDASGNSVLCRVLTGGNIPELAALYEDPRIKQLSRLMPEGLKGANPLEQDGVTVIFKNPNMAEGLSDLPWHRDCGMGGHALMCPTVILSIYLYDATDEAGALRFLPGSHKASFGFVDASDPAAPRGLRADAKAGSVTLHFGDVMHAGPEPRGDCEHYRQSILLTYQPEYQHHRGDRHYNDILLNERNDGQIQNLKTMVTKH